MITAVAAAEGVASFAVAILRGPAETVAVAVVVRILPASCWSLSALVEESLLRLECKLW